MTAFDEYARVAVQWVPLNIISVNEYPAFCHKIKNPKPFPISSVCVISYRKAMFQLYVINLGFSGHVFGHFSSQMEVRDGLQPQ